MSTRRSPQEWRSILSAFHRSGQSQAQFCSERELPLSSPHYQLRRERYRSDDHKAQPPVSPRLIEVTPIVEAAEFRPAEPHPDPAHRMLPVASKKIEFLDDPPEEIIEIDLPESERVFPVSGEDRRFIRWEETIKVNYVPGDFRRLVIRRAVRAVSPATRESSDAEIKAPVITAEMPAEYRVIPGSVAEAGLLAYLLVAIYCDHLPFYRLQQIFRTRRRVRIDRATDVPLVEALQRAALHPLRSAAARFAQR